MTIVSSGQVPAKTPLPNNPTNVQKFLVGIEWSLGNGQCPECYGLCPNWNDFGVHPPRVVGHHKECMLALAMEDAGLSPARGKL